MSKTPDPLSTDFRTLDVLVQVYKLRSFTRAAEAMSMNQSAVSYAIAKLRRILGDPLFVREARHLVATQRCVDAVREAEDLIARFKSLSGPQEFDPESSTETFTLACNYYERVLLVPDIVHAIKRAAPRLKIEIVDSADIGHERLLGMEADLLIGPFERSGEGFYTRMLYEEKYVCLMDHAHPFAKPALSLEEYLGLEHIMVTYGGRWKSRYIMELERRGHDLPIALRTPSPAGMQALITGTDLVATVPERLSKRIGGALHEAGCPVPSPLEIRLVWTARTHAAPMHRWVRELIIRTVTQIA